MFRSITKSAAIMLLAMALPMPAFAQDNAETSAEVDAEVDAEPESEATSETAPQEKAPELPPRKEPSAAVKALNNKVADIIRDIDSDSRAHFYMMYNNHNLISTVKRVQGDVSNAVESCSKENPDMADALQTRFDTWDAAVNEKADESRANIDNMIIAQDYAEEKDLRDIMKQADDLRDETMRQVERIPVSTKEACEYLLNKMDETQDRMVSLLQDTMVTLPQAMQNSRAAQPVTEQMEEEAAPSEEIDESEETAPVEDAAPSEEAPAEE